MGLLPRSEQYNPNAKPGHYAGRFRKEPDIPPGELRIGAKEKFLTQKYEKEVLARKKQGLEARLG